MSAARGQLTPPVRDDRQLVELEGVALLKNLNNFQN
jgi:hypothetical protein